MSSQRLILIRKNEKQWKKCESKMQKLFQENGNFNGKVYHEFTLSDVFIDFEVFNQCNMKV